ncbi:MAG: TIGR01777 family oxidoreductase [Proteobacteria bacterium]|nr:TIGR01777 family oxidoreductase [Pseudomonadota bacterium]
MKVFLTGASGFVGRGLARFLTGQGHQVLLLTRSAGNRPDPGPGSSWVEGDPTRPGPWQDAAAEAEAAVNLAGESIFTRWTPEIKDRILESRVRATRNLVDALTSRGRATVLLSASAVGYYGFRGDEDLDESGTPGRDFLAEVTRQWEAEALGAEARGVRTAVMRFGIVLSADGGALGRMLPLFRVGLGGRLGSGRQWFSWIHRHDLVRAVQFVFERPEAKGAYNFTAPHPITNREFTRALARVIGRPAILPAPGFAVRLALGEFGSVLLEGQKVVPRKLLDLGFDFEFPEIEPALKDLLAPRD